MSLLVINGSPHKGNLDALLTTVFSQQTQTVMNRINMSDLDPKYCDGCEDCLDTEECKYRDLDGALKLLTEADNIIIASPTYFSQVTGKLKSFMDRTNPLTVNSRLAGKRVLLIAIGSCSQEEDSVQRAMGSLEAYCRDMEMEVVGTKCLYNIEDINEVHTLDLTDLLTLFQKLMDL